MQKWIALVADRSKSAGRVDLDATATIAGVYRLLDYLVCSYACVRPLPSDGPNYNLEEFAGLKSVSTHSGNFIQVLQIHPCEPARGKVAGECRLTPNQSAKKSAHYLFIISAISESRNAVSSRDRRNPMNDLSKAGNRTDNESARLQGAQAPLMNTHHNQTA